MGGAIWITDGTLRADGNIFQGNEAPGCGGAVFIDIGADGSYLYTNSFVLNGVYKSNLISGTCEGGGHLAIRSSAHVDKSGFLYGIAHKQGGDILLNANSIEKIAITNNTFYDSGAGTVVAPLCSGGETCPKAVTYREKFNNGDGLEFSDLSGYGASLAILNGSNPQLYHNTISTTRGLSVIDQRNAGLSTSAFAMKNNLVAGDADTKPCTIAEFTDGTTDALNPLQSNSEWPSYGPLPTCVSKYKSEMKAKMENPGAGAINQTYKLGRIFFTMSKFIPGDSTVCDESISNPYISVQMKKDFFSFGRGPECYRGAQTINSGPVVSE